jgi:hypothetical protein
MLASLDLALVTIFVLCSVQLLRPGKKNDHTLLP